MAASAAADAKTKALEEATEKKRIEDKAKLDKEKADAKIEADKAKKIADEETKKEEE